MSSIPIDAKREKMVYLLRKLSQGRLDKEEAQELLPLLKEELEKAISLNKVNHAETLTRLVSSLSLYIEGKINLMPSNLDYIKISNLD